MPLHVEKIGIYGSRVPKGDQDVHEDTVRKFIALGLLCVALGAAVPAAAECGPGQFSARLLDSTTIEVALTWAPQLGAEQYLVQRSTMDSFSSVTTYAVSSAVNAFGDTGKSVDDRLRFGAPSGLIAGTTYYYRVVADMASGPDLISDCVSAQLAASPHRGSGGDLWADLVLGQPDFGQNAFAKTTASVMQWPGGIALDTSGSGTATRVYIADSNNNRVIGFDHIGQCGVAVRTSLAVGRPYTMSQQPAASYPDAGGEFTDGQNATAVQDGDSFGFPGVEGFVDITVDLGSAQSFNAVTLNSGASNPNYTAARVEVFAANTPSDFSSTPDGSSDNIASSNTQDPDRLYNTSVTFPTTTTRYVRFRIYARTPADWLFVGEGKVGLISAAALEAVLDQRSCSTNADCPDDALCVPDPNVQAVRVLGQPSMVDASGCNGDGTGQINPARAPASASSLCLIPPLQVSLGETISTSTLEVDGTGRLYVPDVHNNRIVAFDNPFATDSIADEVWGQADFSGNSCNRGVALSAGNGCRSLCLEGYGAVALDTLGNLWAVDPGNARVLRFPRVGNVIQDTADVVLGQPDCATNIPGDETRSLSQLTRPQDVTFDQSSGRIYVTDASPGTTSSRVLEYVPDPTLGFYTGMSATRALPVSFSCNLEGFLPLPREVYIDSLSHALWVSNSCFFIDRFDLDDPSLTKLSTTRVGNNTGSGVDSSGDLWALNQWAGNTGQLFRYHRDTLSSSQTTQDASAQQIFPKTRAGIGTDDLRFGNGVTPYRNQLIAADGHRLLIWNNFDLATATSHVAADDELGEVDLYTATFTQSWAFPQVVGSELWVMHMAGAREEIQIFDRPLTNCMGGGCVPSRTIPLTPTADFTGYPVAGSPGAMVTAAFANEIDFAAGNGGDEVWVADKWNSRAFRIANLKGGRDLLGGPVVDAILGQDSAAATGCNGRDFNPSASSLCNPGYVTLDSGGNLFVSDNGGETGSTQRLLEFDAGLFPTTWPIVATIGPSASRVYGTGGSFTTWGLAANVHDPRLSPFKPVFSPQGYLLVPNNPYATDRYPFVYLAPLTERLPKYALADYSGYPAGNSSFDADGNLYLYDSDWSRILIYKTPFDKLTFPSSAPTATRSPTAAGTQVATATFTSPLTLPPTATLTRTPTLSPTTTPSPTMTASMTITLTGTLASATPTPSPTQAPSSSYQSLILGDGATPYYRLKESSGPVALDSSAAMLHAAYSSTGVTYGRSSLVSEAGDTSIRVNGAEGGVVIPATSDPIAYTVEAWVRPEGTSEAGTLAPRMLVTRVDATGLFVQALVVQRYGAVARFEHRVKNTNGESIVTCPTAVVAGLTYHVVGTAMKNGMMRLFINGVEEGTALAVGTMTAGHHWQFGINGKAGWTSYQGEIDEVAIYDHVLSGAQISSHYLNMVAPTPSATITETPAATATVAPTDSPTATATPSPTESVTATSTPSLTSSATETSTQTATTTPTQSASETCTASPTQTATVTQTSLPSETETPSPTESVTATSTPSVTTSAAETSTQTATTTPTQSASETCTASPTQTESLTQTSLPSETATPTATPLGLLIHDGRSNPATDRVGCQLSWRTLGSAGQLDRYGQRSFEIACVDGDPACDFDPQPHSCGFRMILCLNNAEPTLPACVPNGISEVSVMAPRAVRFSDASLGAAVLADLAAVNNALTHLADPADPAGGFVYTVPLTPAQQGLCSEPFDIAVPVAASTTSVERRRLLFKIRSFDANPMRRRASPSKLSLTCLSVP